MLGVSRLVTAGAVLLILAYAAPATVSAEGGGRELQSSLVEHTKCKGPIPFCPAQHKTVCEYVPKDHKYEWQCIPVMTHAPTPAPTMGNGTHPTCYCYKRPHCEPHRPCPQYVICVTDKDKCPAPKPTSAPTPRPTCYCYTHPVCSPGLNCPKFPNICVTDKSKCPTKAPTPAPKPPKCYCYERPYCHPGKPCPRYIRCITEKKECPKCRCFRRKPCFRKGCRPTVICSRDERECGHH